MKAVKIILTIILGLLIVIGLLSAIAPTKMSAERSILINAPKEAIFVNVKYLKNIQKWSPWREKDTLAKTNLEGNDGSVGAKFSWDGNKEMGSGSQTITKIVENQLVESDLQFVKPREGKAISYVRLSDSAGATKVTWGFNSEMPRPFNAIGLFMNVDKMIGDEYSKGLEKLKNLAESEAANLIINEITVETRTYIGIKKTVGFDKISDFFAQTMPNLFTKAQDASLKMIGAPSGLYYTYDEKTMTTEVAVVAPVAEVKGNIAPLESFVVKGGKALEMDFHGDYKNLGTAHKRIREYAAKKNLKTTVPVIEEYVTDPMAEKDPNKWVTKIYYFVE
ncbi:MAG: GyrI-like domain-containing protein [bacterium]